MKFSSKTIALNIVLLIVMLPIVQALSLQGPDTKAPEITNISFVHGKPTQINWETDEPANSKVEYGETEEVTLQATKANYERSHSLSLITESEKKYYYKMTSCDTQGNCITTNLESFVAGEFYVTAEIPTHPRATKIDIPGTTRPGATVSIIVDGTQVKKSVIDDGKFLFRNVQINQQSTIVVKAELNGKTAEKTYSVTVDNAPPKITVTVDPVSTSPSVKATIEVSEPATVTIEVPPPEGKKTERPIPKEEKVDSDAVTISWEEIEDVLEYAVYKNGKRIAVVGSIEYLDTSVASDTTYEYQVSAVSLQCVESDLSNILTIKTYEGNSVGRQEQEVRLSCAKPVQIVDVLNKKDVTIPLHEGVNKILFKAKDKAGFTSLAEERVIYDIGPPSFIENNLDRISPSYKRTVTVNGKLSERGSVTAFVNGEPVATEPTAEDGSFSLPVKLVRDVSITIEDTRTELDTGVAWISKVRLEAVDAAGLKATSEEVEIQYALCGKGTWINVEFTSPPIPELLNPRLLLEGLQQAGMAFNYTYQGDKQATIIPGEVRVKKLELSPEFQKEYDNGLITTYSPPVRAVRGRKPTGAGYLQVNFNKIGDPWKLTDEEAPDSPTMRDKEEQLSKYRKEECKSGAVGFGCMRLFLELEIPFTETSQKQTYDPRIQQTVEETVTEHLVQRSCINIEIGIDHRVPQFIPKGLLRATSEFLGTAIDLIDIVLKPIETIGRYLFYTCVAGTFLQYIPIFMEKYACQYKKIESTISGGKFDEKIAEIGACDEQYPGANNAQSRQNCDGCAKAKERRRWVKQTYKQICDRVMCPSAPSLQHYLKTRGRQKLDTVNVMPEVLPKFKGAKKEDGKFLLGSDCAAWMKDKYPEKVPKSLFFKPSEIEQIYRDWLAHQTDEEGVTSGTDCSKAHPATPECCGYEYMQEWGSACGVNGLGGLDTFDEIKESACLSQQEKGSNELTLEGGETLQCNKLSKIFNTDCEKPGKRKVETIQVVPFEGTQEEIKPGSRAAQLGVGISKDKYMYLLVIPPIEGMLQSEAYDFKLGYITKTIEFDDSDVSKNIDDERRHFVTGKIEGIEMTDSDDMKEKFFSEEAIDNYKNLSPKDMVEFYKKFKMYLCMKAGYGMAGCGAKGKAVYEHALSYVHKEDDEYIIEPRKGLINSFRCLCFPTLIGYLQFWKKIMQEVRHCMNTILLTGDGDAGVCQAVISEFACDLLYDVLACFTQKFDVGQSRVDLGGGNVMGALVSAGSDLSREVEGRYGDSSVYKTVFVDRKLMHSVCAFAFTGAWNFDISAMFDASIDDVPIEGVALMTPCNRRFIAFNPTTQPSGLATWQYHFGIFYASGADSDVELVLQCSGGYNCRETDGFKDGKCDCEAPIKHTYVPEGLPSKVKKNEILNEEIFFNVAGSGDRGKIRYDKAFLRYSWNEGTRTKTEQTEPCTITQSGGAGAIPAFCRYDLFTTSFRCRFMEQPGGLSITKVEPKYQYLTKKGESFGLGDLDFLVYIKQDMEDKEIIKHLQYEIVNPYGEVVATNKDGPNIELKTNGDYTKRLGPEKDKGSVARLTATKDWFTVSKEGKRFQIRQWTTLRPNQLTPNRMIEDFAVYTEGGVESKTQDQYILKLENKAGKTIASIYDATADRTIDSKTGFDKLKKLCEKEVTGNSIVCAPAEQKITIRIRLTESRPVEDEIVQSHIEYNIQEKGFCAPTLLEQRKTVPFKLILYSYDTDQWGGISDQLTMDPFTGGEVKKVIDFNVICANEDEMEELRRKYEGVRTPYEIISGLRADVEAAIEMEVKMAGELGNYSEENYQATGTMAALQAYLLGMIDDEQKLREKLKKYINQVGKKEMGQEIKDRLGDKTDELKNIIPGPISKLDNALEKLITKIKDVRKEISKLPGPVKRDVDIAPRLRDIFEVLLEVTEEKDNVINVLETMREEVTTLCVGVDPETEDYHECRKQCDPPYDPDPVKGKKCTGVSVCCKIPKDAYCDGEHFGFNWNCEEGSSCSEGWTADNDFICPDIKTQTCCRQSVKGAAIGSREQLELIKDFLFGNSLFKWLAEQQTKYAKQSAWSDSEASEAIATKHNALVSEVEQLVKELRDNQKELNGLVSRPMKRGEKTKVPEEVKAYSPNLGVQATQIEKQILPVIRKTDITPTELKNQYVLLSTILTSLSYEGTPPKSISDKLLAEINKALGIQDDCPALRKPAPVFHPAPPKTVKEQYYCFKGDECPKSVLFRDWQKAEGYSCGGREVCCSRMVDPMFHKDGVLINPTAKQNFGLFSILTPGKEVKLKVYFPYDEAQKDRVGVIYREDWEWEGHEKGKYFPQPPKVPPKKIEFVDPPEKLAWVEIPAFKTGEEYKKLFINIIAGGGVTFETEAQWSTRCKTQGYFCQRKCEKREDRVRGYSCAVSDQVCCKEVYEANIFLNGLKKLTVSALEPIKITGSVPTVQISEDEEIKVCFKNEQLKIDTCYSMTAAVYDWTRGSLDWNLAAYDPSTDYGYAMVVPLGATYEVYVKWPKGRSAPATLILQDYAESTVSLTELDRFNKDFRFSVRAQGIPADNHICALRGKKGPIVKCWELGELDAESKGYGLYYTTLYHDQYKDVIDPTRPYYFIHRYENPNYDRRNPIAYGKGRWAATKPILVTHDNCGNFKLDPEEICDYDKEGLIMVTDTNIVNPPRGRGEFYRSFEKVITWTVDGEKFKYDTKQDLCSDFIGQMGDCSEDAKISFKNGKCVGCTELWPRIICVDDDPVGDDGRSAWYYPKFYVDFLGRPAGFKGVPRSLNSKQYIASDKEAGSNACVPSGWTPKWDWSKTK